LLRDERLPLQRKQLVPLLRAAGAGLTFTPNEAVRKAAYDEGYEAGRQRADMDWHRYEYEMETANASKLQREASDLVTEVEEILGVELRSWRSPENAVRRHEVVRALRAVLAGDDAAKRSTEALERAASDLEQKARWLRQLAGKYSNV
jgi:hypothetical protein